MKLQITGASNFVNRMFEAAGSYQWAREFLMNSIEAGAKHVEFGIEWEALAKTGVYRRTIADDGAGMDKEQILKFFSTLGAGAKAIGGLHENFGIGAKIASLPWNSNGVVVISYQGGKGSMIWILHDDATNEYELVEFSHGRGHSCVVEPSEVDGIHWDKIKPSWIKDHGTIVVLMGSDDHPNTVLGNVEGGESAIKGLSTYLNTRFWDLTKHEVHVLEMRSEHKHHWPRGPHENEDDRRPNRRLIQGAGYYLDRVQTPKGKLEAKDSLSLNEGRVNAEWYLWSGERPAIDSYARKNGYIAVRYGDELFEVTAGKVDFRSFGIVESKVQQNLTIILQPQKYEPDVNFWGVHPDQSRNRLIFTGQKPNERGVAIPLQDWGLEFSEKIPAAILAAIQAARGETSGNIEDEAYRKRLQDKFGSRWSVTKLVQARKNEPPMKGTLLSGHTEANARSDLESEAGEDEGGRERKVAKAITRRPARKDGEQDASEIEAPMDVPKYRFAPKENFQRPWHMAMWAPHDPEGPVVLINVSAPVLNEIVKYHQDQYPPHFAEEIAVVIRMAIGEIAACKVAHAQKLTRLIPEEEVDRDYRNEASLTVGLMGLLAEEAVIAQRLGKHLGRHHHKLHAVQ